MKTILKYIIIYLFIISSQNIYSQNKSLYLNDSLSYGIIPHSASFSTIAANNKFTFECWINPGNTEGPIISKEGCWIIEYNFSNIFVRINSFNPNSIQIQLAKFTWQHLAITFDGNINECKYYINGILKGAKIISQDIPNIFSDIYIGRRVFQNNYLNSVLLLDEVRVWNLVRSEQEIFESFQMSLSGNQTGLIANYNLNNVSNNILIDSSPYNNNASLFGTYEISDDVFVPNIYSSSLWYEKTRINATGISYLKISCPNNNTVWLLGSKTIDGADNWVTYNLPDTSSGFVYYYISAKDENNCLITGSSSSITKVWKTTDGGISWSEVFSQASGFVNSIIMVNENTGYMMGDPVGGRWSLWKTIDGGSNWDSTGLYLPQQSNEYSYVGNMSCKQNSWWIFYSTNGGFYKSTDFTNFIYQSTTNGYYGIDLLFTDYENAVVYTTLMEKRILKTSDGGASFVNSSGIPVYNTNVGSVLGMLAKVNSEIFAVRGGNVLKSIDNGFSFAPSFSPGDGNLELIVKSEKAENNITSVYMISKYGKVYKADIQTTGIHNTSNKIPEYFSLSQNYPNPFNPTTKIKFDLKISGMVKIRIYDIMGKDVATLVNENLSTGSYETEFNGSGLTSGVYFYKIETDNYSEVKKMTLLK